MEIHEEDDKGAVQLAGTLALAGTVLFADDATGIGVVDDPIATFLYVAAGAIYTYNVVQSFVNSYDTGKQYTMPMAAEHTKGKRPSTKQKHTKRRPGETYGKHRNEPRGNKNRKREHPINPNKRR